jgi:hypothetical protein
MLVVWVSASSSDRRSGIGRCRLRKDEPSAGVGVSAGDDSMIEPSSYVVLGDDSRAGALSADELKLDPSSLQQPDPCDTAGAEKVVVPQHELDGWNVDVPQHELTGRMVVYATRRTCCT